MAVSDAADSPFASTSIAGGYREHLEPVIFRPWAQRLVDVVDLRDGETVLDVAAGTGVVARAASQRVGRDGRVIASDISEEMLIHVRDGRDEHAGCPIETVVCSATALDVADSSVDAVLCQQGFPFIPDRVAAAGEMARVLRSGGRAAVAMWLAGARLDPFVTFAEVLRVFGIPEPMPGAFDQSRFTMSEQELRGALESGGLDEVTVTVEEVTLDWASPDAAARAITGTPFVAGLAGLPEQRREEVMDALRDAMTAADGGARRHVMTAIFGHGTA